MQCSFWFAEQGICKFYIGWELDLYTLTSSDVGIRCSHSRLNCSQEQHWFCENQQNLTLGFHSIHFNTFFLARFTDCGLLELHLLLLRSHFTLRVPCATILQMDKLFFRLKSHTLLLFKQTRIWTPDRFFIIELLFQLSYVLNFMDDEVCVWTYAPFECIPFITTLWTLLSVHFGQYFLSFDLRK